MVVKSVTFVRNEVSTFKAKRKRLMKVVTEASAEVT